MIKGKDVQIDKTAILIHDENIKIGDGSWVGSYCNFRPVEHKITLGKNVIVAQNVAMIADSHNYQDVTKPIKDQGIYGGDITIEDNTWIGCNSVILHNVKIGQGSVVGAGSVVTKNVPPYCVVAGMPARIIKKYSPKRKKWLKYNYTNKLLFKLGLF